jgi:transcriptional coactivator HFI1/ADA1
MHPSGYTESQLPKPDLGVMRDLLNLQPGLHPQNSAVLHKLATADMVEDEEIDYKKIEKRKKGGEKRVGEITDKLVEGGLLKLDKAGKDGEGEGGKKERKHGLHWKYEDPAMLLKDILG